MARRKPIRPASVSLAQEAPTNPGGRKAAPEGQEEARETRVSHVPFEDSRELRTYDSEDDCWNFGLRGVFPPKGSIVRLRPPGDVAGIVVEKQRRVLLEEGMAAVRVQPGRRAAVLPREKMQHMQPKARAREAAMKLVEEATTLDREALKAAVEQALAEAGL